MAKQVIVVPYNEQWKTDFEIIKEYLLSEVKNTIIGIEHIGSTSVEGLSAKPIIDIDIVIKDYSVFNSLVDRLVLLGYIHEGNLGIKNREVFDYVGKVDLPKHHLYVCPEFSAELHRHIAFRDYLRNNSDSKLKYSKLKEEGANLYPDSIDDYIAYKSPCIEEIYKKCGLLPSIDIGDEMTSHIEIKNGTSLISVNGELHYPLAYTTYFDECGEYSDFINSGYKMFFVNVSFTDLPINNITGFTPFRTGVFESNKPDYSEFDGNVRRILSECPDALIFPRINIAMPRKWIAENSDETVETKNGGARESLCSDAFLRDGAELLKALVSHIRSADYSGRIAGYQLCGGTTQEWMHHDLFGSFSDMGLKKFREWMFDKYGVADAPIPERKDFDSGILTETTSRYGEFCCEMAAKTAEHFAKELKEYINGEQIVGIFYGYSAFVSDYLLGLHGLRHIIDSPYIDFFSSPCCYDGNRNLGIDWGDMIPVDSVKLHGKLCFIECDIRTHLTKRMQDSRPGRYPDNIYTLKDINGNKTVWSGPDTFELSLSAIRKAFAHQLTKGSGIWWFDMWGGWYHDEIIMAEIERMKNIAKSSTSKNSADYPRSEAVLFIDETAYANIARGNPLCGSVSTTRVAMGNTGIPFDLCMVEDAPKVIDKYRAAIFTAPIPSECGKAAVELCKNLNVPYIQPSEAKPFYNTDELRDFLVSSGVHCYNSDGCVVYIGGGYLGIHSIIEGEININLPQKYRVKPLFGATLPECETDTITLNIKKYGTAFFEFLPQNC